MLDRQLLERYTQSQDQQAFAELVRRHLALVHAAARHGRLDSFIPSIMCLSAGALK